MKNYSKPFLSGYRVLDLTNERGWFCGKLLADLGAEVLLIENRVRKSTDFLNRSKKHLTIRLKTRQGNASLKNLINTSDVLLESSVPGYLNEIGLGYNQLKKINPKIIMASITPFGQTGAYRNYKTSDLVAAAMGGWMSVCGDTCTPPLKLFGKQAYYTACLFAANAVLLALIERRSSGMGQYIDVSIHECVAGTLDHVLPRYFYLGEVAGRQGSIFWNNAFRIFQCKDGFILLTIFYQWDTLIEWIDSEGKAEDLVDKKWLDEKYRQINIKHVIEVLERWTLSHKVAELVEQGQLMHFPWANVASIPELVNDPHLVERGFFLEDESGTKYPGLPFH